MKRTQANPFAPVRTVGLALPGPPLPLAPQRTSRAHSAQSRQDAIRFREQRWWKNQPEILGGARVDRQKVSGWMADR
jgi:hypothetical protein